MQNQQIAEEILTTLDKKCKQLEHAIESLDIKNNLILLAQVCLEALAYMPASYTGIPYMPNDTEASRKDGHISEGKDMETKAALTVEPAVLTALKQERSYNKTQGIT